jgi:hypothetical protein
LSLTIETTSIAALVWLNNDSLFAANTQRAIEWIVTTSKNGMFGSTQATVLALKALIAYDIARAVPAAPGAVSLSVDDKIVQTLEFTPETKTALIFKDISELLHENKRHKLQLKMTGGSQMPFSVHVEMVTPQPANSDHAPLRLTTSLLHSTLNEGESDEVQVQVQNIKNESLGMVVAVIGLPSGLEPRYDLLKELQQSSRISFFEINGREVVLYWRGMAPNQVISVKSNMILEVSKLLLQLNLDVIAAIPGTYVSSPSRVYEYYNDEYKFWAKPLHLTISPLQ